MKIKVENAYRTNNGLLVRIICIDRVHKTNPVIGLIRSGDSDLIEVWNSQGISPNPSLNLNEITEWDDYKLDEPVFVRDSAREPWKHAHFASVNCGKAHVWEAGKTSHTGVHSIPYNYCQRTIDNER